MPLQAHITPHFRRQTTVMPDDDKAAYQERLDRISAIFTDLVAHAEVSSRTRCPYRDRHDLCTALFRCRNQLAMPGEEDQLACGHDGTFDYRTAWEAHPRSRARAREKIAEIKRQAESRRLDGTENGHSL